MGLLGAIAQAAELAPQSRQFADSMLLFNPIKLAGLIVWVYVCLYFVNLAEFSSSVPKHRKALVNFLTLFLGPIPLSMLTLTRIAKRYAGSSHSILRLSGRIFPERLTDCGPRASSGQEANPR
jgi:hypothetical protein